MTSGVLGEVSPLVETYSRSRFDVAAYRQQARAQGCFICSLSRGEARARAAHHIIYEDPSFLVFLNRYPTLLGQTLVCPREHCEEVTADFSEEAYLRLQRLVHRVAEAVRRVVPSERIYIVSLGSQQGNSHVHWHVAPLPPGTNLADQQLAAFDCRRGVLDVPPSTMSMLARRIRAQLGADAA
jgi:ATP adenylyltransferase